MGTFNATVALSAQKDWFLVDASNKTLGRLATEVARRLRGKHKPIYTPFLDTGDFIVIVNAEKIRVTGNKIQDKKYYHHTGQNIREINLKDALAKKPVDVITKAVGGMLPKGPLGRQMISKLKVYAGAEHPHIAQNPKPLEIEE
jgi:large subunit ribosomal protein L13